MDVKDKIDPNSENYPALLRELESRKEEIDRAEEVSQKETFKLAEQRVKVIGCFQIAAAIVTPFLVFFTENISALTISIAFAVILLNIFAGYTALKGLQRFYWLSIINQSLQLVTFGLGSTFINYSGLGGIYLGITFADTTSLSLSANFTPGLLYQEFTSKIAEPFIAVDIMAVIFIAALVTVSNTTNKTIKKLTT